MTLSQNHHLLPQGMRAQKVIPWTNYSNKEREEESVIKWELRRNMVAGFETVSFPPKAKEKHIYLRPCYSQNDCLHFDCSAFINQ